MSFTDRERLLMADEEMLDRFDAGEYRPNTERYLTPAEKNKRGCAICAYMKPVKHEVVPKNGGHQHRKYERWMMCSFDHCPLHELDGYKSYSDYCREQDDKLERMLARALKLKVKKMVEPEPKPKKLDKRTRWLLKVRVSQGARLHQICGEFGLSEKQAVKEMEKAKG